MGSSIKKRSHPEGSKGAGSSKGQRPTKKQRKAAAYHSSSEEESDDDDNGGSLPANLLDSDIDSDEDSGNAFAVGSLSEEEGTDSDSSDEESRQKPAKPLKSALKSSKESGKKKTKEFKARDAPESSSSEDNETGSEAEDSDVEMASDDDDPLKSQPNTKSKRNDPEAFATSISKMLSSKLPTSKRADPIVARSAESAAAARQVVDTALESKARKRLREQKRLAMEKGRVRDVLMPTTTKTLNIVTGEVEETVVDDKTTADIIATERRLAKVAQRGVVRLFNVLRAAQVGAAEAQKVLRQEGVVGTKRREEKVTEMSRQAFLSLIASGGGGLKKGGLEEA